MHIQIVNKNMEINLIAMNSFRFANKKIEYRFSIVEQF
jgi:hypothetical protein